MKIKTIEIYGYGKWVDQIFQVNESMQVFYGGNEAGKTTLMSFVHSVLFGFPHRQSSELRYEPKTASRYGGKLWIEDPRYGSVSIERVKGRASGEVSVVLENGQTGSDQLLNEVLYGMDKEWYQSIFSFNLEGVQHIERMTKDKLNRFFLSAGTLGTEQFLKESDRLNNLASKLYKPTGRVPEINKKMKEVEKKRRRVDAAKKKNGQYVELVNEKQRIEQSIAETREQIKQTEDTLARLKQMEKEWPRYEELRTLQQELNRVSLEMLPEDGLHQLNHFNNELEELRTAEIHEQEKIRQYQQTYQPSKLLDFYQTNEAQFQQMEEELEEVRVNIARLQQLVKDEEETKQRLLKEKLRLGLNPIDALPDELTKEEAETITSLTEEWSTAAGEMEEVQSRLSLLEYKRQSLFDEIDALENRLWSNAEFERAKKAMEQKQNWSTETPASNKTNVLSIQRLAALAGGTGAVAAGFFLPEPFGWIAWTVGVFLLVMMAVAGKKANDKSSMNKETNTPTSTDSYEAFIQQKEIRKNWRMKLAESDEAEQGRRDTEREKDTLESQQQSVLQQWSEIQSAKRFPENWTLEETLKKEEDIQSIRSEERHLNEKRKQIKEINAYLNKWKQSLKVIQDELDPAVSFQDLFRQVKRMFQAVKEEEKRQKEYVSRFKEANRELERLVREIKKTETKKRRLLRAVDAETEEDFRNKYALREETQHKKTRWEWLKNQLEESLDMFETIQSKEEVVKAREEAAEQIQQLKDEEEKQTNGKIQKEVDIRQLEEGGDYAVLLQEYENSKSELQSLVDEWASLKVAASLIERTLNYAKKDRLPGTIADAEKYFYKLTDGNYTQIKLEDDSLKVLRSNNLLYDASELSRGTAEQLYVSLRLAFINNIRDAMELPLLVDDGFVNFDPLRKRRVWSLLEKISEHTQVLYFTFDQEAVEEFQQDAVIML